MLLSSAGPRPVIIFATIPYGKTTKKRMGTAMVMVVVVMMMVMMAMACAADGRWVAPEEFVPPEYNSTVWEAFYAKTLLNPLPHLPSDPYADAALNTTWVDRVCAAVYPVAGDRQRYELH